MTIAANRKRTDKIIATDFDKNLMKELKSRSKSLVNGSAKTYSWGEKKAAAIKKVNRF